MAGDSSAQSERSETLEEAYRKLWARNRGPWRQVEGLETKLGYSFVSRIVLYEALTHRSAALPKRKSRKAEAGEPVQLPWNERLEFLGDAVLNLVVSQALMQRAEGFPEGELSKIRASLVNEESLAAKARHLNLGDCLLLGKGEQMGGGRDKDSLLADGLEALIGAVFTDGGYEAAKAVVMRLFEDSLSGTLKGLMRRDFKTRLQELTQDVYRETPVYDVSLESGPDHAKVFEVVVRVNERALGRGQGASKKRASQAAAKQALDVLTKEMAGAASDGKKSNT